MLFFIITGLIVIPVLFVINVYFGYRRATKSGHSLYKWPLVGNIPELLMFHRGFVPGMFRELIRNLKPGQVAKCKLIQDITLVNDRKLWQILSKDERLLLRGPSNSPIREQWKWI